MTYYAKINDSKIVEEVILAPSGNSDFDPSDLGLDGDWVAVSNTEAKVSKGFLYDSKAKTFTAPVDKAAKEEEAKETQRLEKLESARAKLTALGLDEAEVNALLGL